MPYWLQRPWSRRWEVVIWVPTEYLYCSMDEMYIHFSRMAQLGFMRDGKLVVTQWYQSPGGEHAYGPLHKGLAVAIIPVCTKYYLVNSVRSSFVKII